MSIICPTVTAYNLEQYNLQIAKLSPISKRIHIDLMDGHFAPSLSPNVQDLWLPKTISCDIHFMYQRPMDYLHQLIKLEPRMVIIHNEAEVHHMLFAAYLHQAGILAGLAILQETPIEYAYQIMHSYDQVLIFSGKLGYHGGVADLSQLEKVLKIKQHHPEAEIAWDGGINLDNITAIKQAGVDVYNVGGYLMNSRDIRQAYAKLEEAIK